MLTQKELLELYPIIKIIEKTADQAEKKNLIQTIKNPIASKVVLLQDLINARKDLNEALKLFTVQEALEAFEFFIHHIKKITDDFDAIFPQKWMIIECLYNLLDANKPECLYQILKLNLIHRKEWGIPLIVKTQEREFIDLVLARAAAHSDLKVIRILLELSTNKPSQKAIHDALAVLIDKQTSLIDFFSYYLDFSPIEWPFVQNLFTVKELSFDQDTITFVGGRAADQLNLEMIRILCNPQSHNKAKTPAVSRMLKDIANPRDDLRVRGWGKNQDEITRLLIAMKGDSAPSSESIGEILFYLAGCKQVQLMTTIWNEAENKPSKEALRNILSKYMNGQWRLLNGSVVLFLCDTLEGDPLAQPLINEALGLFINDRDVVKQLLGIKAANQPDKETVSAVLKRLTGQRLQWIPWDLVELFFDMEGPNQPDKDSILFALNIAAQQFNYAKLVALCELKAIKQHPDIVTLFLEQQREKERLQREQAEAQQRQQVEAQQRAEAQQRQQAEAQQRAQAEAQKRVQDEARQRAEAEAQKRAQDEDEARQRAEAEAQKRAQDEARQRAEAEAQKRAQDEAQQRVEAEAQKRAQDEAQQRAEVEAQKLAHNEAQQRAEVEAHKGEQDEAQQRAQEEAQREAEQRSQTEALAAETANKTIPVSTHPIEGDTVEPQEPVNQKLASNLQNFEENKAKIQEQFKSSLNVMKGKLDSLNQGLALFDDLNKKQEEFFKELKIDATVVETASKIQHFRNFCAEKLILADKIMGHGWLYRTVEVLLKAVVGLLAGVGMVVGVVLGQGLANSEHRKKFVKTFFTLNQNEQSQSIAQFKGDILGDDEAHQGLICFQSLTSSPS